MRIATVVFFLSLGLYLLGVGIPYLAVVAGVSALVLAVIALL